MVVVGGGCCCLFCCKCEGFGEGVGFGAMGGFGGTKGFWEREGAVCCLVSLCVVPVPGEGGGGVGMLPVELVFGRVRDL